MPPPLPKSTTTPPARRRRRLLHDRHSGPSPTTTALLGAAAASLLLLSSTLVGIALTARNNEARRRHGYENADVDAPRDAATAVSTSFASMHPPPQRLRPTTPPPPWRRGSTTGDGDGDCPRLLIPGDDGRGILRPGGFVCSPSDRYRFGLGDDGRLGLWGERNSTTATGDGGGPRDKIWSAETCCDDARAVLQADGNFVVYGEDDEGEAGVRPLWATDTDVVAAAVPASNGTAGFALTVSDGGTVVLSDGRGDELWSLSAGGRADGDEEPRPGCPCRDVVASSSPTRGGLGRGGGRRRHRDHPPRVACPCSPPEGTNGGSGEMSSSSNRRIIAHRWDYSRPKRVIHRVHLLMYRPPRGDAIAGGENAPSPSLAASGADADLDLDLDADRKSQSCQEESWFEGMHPSCNVLHERDLLAGVGTALLGNGNSRQVWGVVGGGGPRGMRGVGTIGSDSGVDVDVEADAFVLKSLRLDRPFAPRYYEKHRIDAVALDRLTSSPRIVDIHGHCGQSSLNERADVSLSSYVAERRRKEDDDGDDDPAPSSVAPPLTPGERLRLARDVALALRDAHAASAVDGDVDVDGAHPSESRHASAPNAPVAILHEDVTAGNVLLFSAGSGGDSDHGKHDRRGSPVVKLDDFNSAHFLPRGDVGGGGGAAHPAVATGSGYDGTSSCAVKRNEHCDHYRSPEQCRGDYLDELHDVFSLGGVVYFLATNGLTPYSYPVAYGVEDVGEMILNGTGPGYPPSIRDSVDGAIVAMRNVVAMSRAHDPDNRPSSSEVADALGRALEGYYT